MFSYAVLKRKYQEVKEDKDYFFNENRTLYEANQKLKEKVSKLKEQNQELKRELITNRMLLKCRIDYLVYEMNRKREFGENEEK